MCPSVETFSSPSGKGRKSFPQCHNVYKVFYWAQVENHNSLPNDVQVSGIFTHKRLLSYRHRAGCIDRKEAPSSKVKEGLCKHGLFGEGTLIWQDTPDGSWPPTPAGWFVFYTLWTHIGTSYVWATPPKKNPESFQSSIQIHTSSPWSACRRSELETNYKNFKAAGGGKGL